MADPVESFFANVKVGCKVVKIIHDSLVKDKFPMEPLVTVGINAVIPGFVESFEKREDKISVIKRFLESVKDHKYLITDRNDDNFINCIPILNSMLPMKIPADMVGKALNHKDKDGNHTITAKHKKIIWDILNKELEYAEMVL